MKAVRWIPLLGLILLVTVAAGCAPGNVRFNTAAPAGFWAGLWHGFICVITFVVSLFSDKVSIYEVHNSGGWYNLGFLIGAACFFGGSWTSGCGRRKKSSREREWEQIGIRVEDKVRRGIKRWLDESEKSDPEWEKIGRKIEEEIKRELRKWADS